MNIEPGFTREASQTVEMIDEDAAAHRRKRLIIIAAVIGAVLLVVLLLIRGLGHNEQAPPEPAPRVTVIVPGTQTVARIISATGTLAARREMPVGVAGEGGMVDRVLVEPGDWVRAGQPLATINAAVEAQQANQLSAQIRASEADAAIADSELKRSLALVGRGFVSQADVDRKTATRDAALARVGVARAQLGEMRARIGRLAIRAPAGGLVLTRQVEPGQVVGPGNGALFRIAKDGEIELRAKLSEGDLGGLHVGDIADVTPVGSAQRFPGTVWQLSPVVDPVSRQGEARIKLGYNQALRPGAFAGTNIKNGSAIAPLLPESAVLSDEKGNFVYIVGPDKKVARRDVKVGVVGNNGLPIISGLSGNEKIVLSAGAFLSPGDPVIPVLEKRGK